MYVICNHYILYYSNVIPITSLEEFKNLKEIINKPRRVKNLIKIINLPRRVKNLKEIIKRNMLHKFSVYLWIVFKEEHVCKSSIDDVWITTGNPKVGTFNGIYSKMAII